jgi:hypothetical protein
MCFIKKEFDMKMQYGKLIVLALAVLLQGSAMGMEDEQQERTIEDVLRHELFLTVDKLVNIENIVDRAKRDIEYRDWLLRGLSDEMQGDITSEQLEKIFKEDHFVFHFLLSTEKETLDQINFLTEKLETLKALLGDKFDPVLANLGSYARIQRASYTWLDKPWAKFENLSYQGLMNYIKLLEAKNASLQSQKKQGLQKKAFLKKWLLDNSGNIQAQFVKDEPLPATPSDASYPRSTSDSAAAESSTGAAPMEEMGAEGTAGPLYPSLDDLMVSPQPLQQLTDEAALRDQEIRRTVEEIASLNEAARIAEQPSEKKAAEERIKQFEAQLASLRGEGDAASSSARPTPMGVATPARLGAAPEGSGLGGYKKEEEGSRSGFSPREEMGGAEQPASRERVALDPKVIKAPQGLKKYIATTGRKMLERVIDKAKEDGSYARELNAIFTQGTLDQQKKFITILSNLSKPEDMENKQGEIGQILEKIR